MMAKVTISKIEAHIDILNDELRCPAEPYDKKGKAQPGNYYLSQANGGVSLHQMQAGGGVTDVFRCGHTTKRDLLARIDALIIGIDTAKKAAA
jgi:hypothetical protein